MVVWIAPREPRPDAPCWRGRRLLAALDAATWPAAVVLLLMQWPAAAALVWPAAVVAGLWALVRLCEAVFVNHRYWFTTWRWARFVAPLLLVWMVMKLVLPA
jgi:hypothetical protein